MSCVVRVLHVCVYLCVREVLIQRITWGTLCTQRGLAVFLSFPQIVTVRLPATIIDPTNYTGKLIKSFQPLFFGEGAALATLSTSQGMPWYSDGSAEYEGFCQIKIISLRGLYIIMLFLCPSSCSCQVPPSSPLLPPPLPLLPLSLDLYTIIHTHWVRTITKIKLYVPKNLNKRIIL